MNWIDENLDKWKWAVSVTKEELRPLIEEAYQRGTQEALAKVEEWAKEDESKCDCDMYSREGCQHSHTDLLHHLQQLKDNNN